MVLLDLLSFGTGGIILLTSFEMSAVCWVLEPVVQCPSRFEDVPMFSGAWKEGEQVLNCWFSSGTADNRLIYP